MRTKKIFLVIGAMLLVTGLSCRKSDEKTQPIPTEEDLKNRSLSGKELSLIYCQSCHMYPEPSTLDRYTWERSVLPKMGRLFGIYEDNATRREIIEGAIDPGLVEEQDIFPEEQLISTQEWRRIVNYYISSAPESLQIKKRKDKSFAPLEGFEIIKQSIRKEPFKTTFLKFDSESSNIYIGEANRNTGALTILNKNFEIIQNILLSTPPTDLSISDNRLALTLAGSLVLAPSNNRLGELIFIYRNPGDQKYSSFRKFPNDLSRPVQIVFEDITGNGLEDILIAEFGYYTGSLTLYENSEGKQKFYKKNILKNVPGAIKAYVEDMDSDGDNDIVALFAQGDEGISIFYNYGQGEFIEERVLRFNPSYGSVYFELVDFNKDGFLDILYCNGDNGDYPPVLKNYHGIRIFENDRQNKFHQVYFFPMNGAFKCSAADFDMDGDLEIIAISYFPDFMEIQRRDFVYLKNLGNYSFSPQYLEKDMPARWITFDIGDLDGDGFKDVVLGALGTYPANNNRYGGIPQQDSSILLLKNLGE